MWAADAKNKPKRGPQILDPDPVGLTLWKNADFFWKKVLGYLAERMKEEEERFTSLHHYLRSSSSRSLFKESCQMSAGSRTEGASALWGEETLPVRFLYMMPWKNYVLFPKEPFFSAFSLYSFNHFSCYDNKQNDDLNHRDPFTRC